MEITPVDVIHLGSSGPGRPARPTVPGSSPVRIRRGVGLVERDLAERTRPWDVRRRVAEARVLGAADQCHRQLVFTLCSALLVWGVDGWVDNPDVTFICRGRYRTLELRAVRVEGVHVPAVKVRQMRISQEREAPTRVHGVWVTSLEETALDFACRRHPLEAFVAVSMIMRRLVGFDRFQIWDSRQRAERLRGHLLDMLAQRKGARGRRRAQHILELADPGCESIGECALVWILLTIAPELPVTQVEIHAEGSRFFADVALPGPRIIFEFDGVGKMGRTEREVREALRRQLRRQEALEREGWRVVRVRWEDLREPDALRVRLCTELGWQGRMAFAEGGGLWAPVPRELVHPTRRL